MTTDQKELIVLLGEFYRRQKSNPNTKWTWGNIAKTMGMSSEWLLSWRQGKQKNGKTDMIVAEFLNSQEQEEENKKFKIDFKMTKAADLVFDTLNFAWATNQMCAVVSRAGYGKTFSLCEYQRRHKETLIIEARVTQQTHMLLYELAEKVGANKMNASDFIFRRVVAKLRLNPALLVFDEAQFYRYNTLETIRRIHDQANCPVVLFGSYSLYDQLVGKKVKDFDQLLSRIIRRELPELDAEDVKLLLEDNFKDELNDKIINKLLEMCQGSARMLIKNIHLAQTMFEQERVSFEQCQKAHAFLLAA